MIYKQLITPNLDPVVYDGGKMLTDWYEECLATTETSFGTARSYSTAQLEWDANPDKHEDRNFPVDVYFPMSFSGAGGAGHKCIGFVNTNGVLNIWTSPWKHIPYFMTYDSIEQLEADYKVTYVGWSTQLAGSQVIEAIPDPVPPPAAPAIIYTRLESTLNLVTNKQPTKWWNLGFSDYSNAQVSAELPENTPFAAYGKAERTDLDHPVYYMTEADFGQADTTGTPVNNNGVNTVDLSPAPAEEIIQVSVPGIATSSTPMSTVTPVAPTIPDWQKTTKNVADYEAIDNYPVEDLASGAPAADLVTGQTVHAAVRFTKNDTEGRPVEYVMTQKSVDAGKFNGVPMAVLKMVKPIDIEVNENSLLDDLKLEELQPVAKIAGSELRSLAKRIKSDKSFRDKIVSVVARVLFRSKKQKI